MGREFQMTSFIRKALRLGDGKLYVGYYMETDGGSKNVPLPGESPGDPDIRTSMVKPGVDLRDMRRTAFDSHRRLRARTG